MSKDNKLLMVLIMRPELSAHLTPICGSLRTFFRSYSGWFPTEPLLPLVMVINYDRLHETTSCIIK